MAGVFKPVPRRTVCLALVLCALVFLFTPLRAPAETGNISQYKTSGDWFSFVLDISSGRIFRAGVKNGSDVFVIDYNTWSEEFLVSMNSINLSRNVVDSWKPPYKDKIRVKVRIDLGPIRECMSERLMIKEDGTLYWVLDKQFHSKEFFKELSSGTTLRLRSYHDTAGALTYVFPLQGSRGAITRMLKLAGAYADKDYDPYFDGTPKKPAVPKRTPPKKEEVPSDDAFFI